MPGQPGPTGQTGPIGPKGETGSQGEKGEASSVGRALFSAYRSSGGHFDGIVTFDVVDIDKENQLDKESGIFKCKVPGVYLFSLSGEATTDGTDYVSVYVNNDFKFIIADTDKSNYANLSYSWTLKLSLDDQVQLKVATGKMYASPTERVYFTGLLIHAD